MLEGKRIIVGITGSIAAYKAVDVVRSLRKHKAEVMVAMTRSAEAFITPLTLAALSQRPVYHQVVDGPDAWKMDHISFAINADLYLIAPATANIIAKITHGLADDPVSLVALDTLAPIFMVPAMNTRMYQNAVTQQNIALLKSRGCSFLGPHSGPLASGESGEGRFLEPAEIVDAVLKFFSKKKDLNNFSVLVTAGPTVEAWDPIRYFTNRSSGKMGYALARAAQQRGAKVTLISGPTNLEAPAGVKFIPVQSAAEMKTQVFKNRENHKVIIMSAAVMDYRPQEKLKTKFKKLALTVDLKLVQNEDILAELGKTNRSNLLVGFTAENEADLVKNAKAKIKNKKLDFIVANPIDSMETGFGSDYNKVTIIKKDGQAKSYPVLPKDQVADIILDQVAPDLAKRKRDK